jgi:hypothetical protein
MQFWSAVPSLVLAYWGVVMQAGTDNLTELIAEPQALAFVVLCAWLFTVFFAAALIASPSSAGQRIPRLAAGLISLPLAALFLYVGLAGEIHKYDQQFSALQFLLSPDRQHYATQTVIWLRYGALHVLVITALSFIQWPYFRAAQRLHSPASHAFH